MTFASIEALHDAIGKDLGYSDWITIDQARINQFAEATGDHQWIHVDPERAAQGPFKTTIAHGYLTLSLAPTLLDEIMEVSGVAMLVNYGLNKLRFPAPVPVGSQVRAGATLAEVEDVAGGAPESYPQVLYAVMEWRRLPAILMMIAIGGAVIDVVMLQRNESAFRGRAESYPLLGTCAMPSRLKHHPAADYELDWFA